MNQNLMKKREIEFGKLMRYMVRHAGLLLCCAATIGILFGAVRYYQDYSRNKAEYEKALNENENSSKEELVMKLSDDEYQNVLRGFYFWQVEQDATEYLSQSILMQTNPYNKQVTDLFYACGESEPERQLIELKADVFDEDFLEAVTTDTGWDTLPAYISELLQVSNENGYLCVEVAANTRENCDALAACITKKLNGKYGSPISVSTVEVDLQLVERFNRVYDNRAAANEVFHGYEVNFTNTQHRLCTILTYEYLGRDLADYLGTENGGTVQNGTDIDTNFVLFGFLTGLFGAVFVLGIAYTLSGRLHGEEEYKMLFHKAVLGTIDTSGKNKRYDESLEYVVQIVKRVCKKSSVSKVLLAGSTISEEQDRLLGHLESVFAANELTCVRCGNLTCEPDAIGRLQENAGVLFIEWDEKSMCRDIARELDFCAEHEIHVIGTVLAQR